MNEGKDKDQGSGGPMEMGMGMAKKMMAQMGMDDPNPMAMMQKKMSEMAEGGQQPPPMMQMCMGMCAEMLTAIKRTSEMASFASPELHGLFAEWLGSRKDRAIQLLQKNGAMDLTDLAKALEISEESAAYLLAHLAKGGKVNLRAETISGGE